jgi:hypothetical protein
MAMSGSSERPVKITAEERPHAALRKLARACIALALNAVEKTPTPQDAPAEKPPAPSPSGELTSKEQAHG